MSIFTFLIQGSAPDPYQIDISIEGQEFSAICSCPAGVFGKHCKHRLWILSGATKGIVSGNEAEVAEVVSAISGTNIEEAVVLAQEAERALAKAKRQSKAAKEELSLVMHCTIQR